MKQHYSWYERLFYRLNLYERRIFRIILGSVLLLGLIQALLTLPEARKVLVLLERLEGEPATFYKSLNGR